MSCIRFLTWVGLCVALVCGAARAQGFGNYEHFPVPAAGSFGIVGAALEDGRLLLWNGDTVYLQFAPGADSFSPVGSGYVGDPGFLIPFPNGNDFLLGAGFGGNLYRFNPGEPADYSPAALIGSVSHYAAAFLSDELLLLDVGTFDPETFETGSQLVTFDLSGAKAGITPVVTKGPEYFSSDAKTVDKPDGAYSSSVFTDTANGIVYAMDGNTTELRRFSVAALVNAHNTAADLDWAADGTLVGDPGDFLSGGVSAIDVSGRLVIAGFGGVQFVAPSLGNPANAAVVETLAPAGSFEFYSVIYNPYFDSIITRIFNGDVQTQEETLVNVPALGLTGLGILTMLLAGVALKRR
ncbi:MAG: hypothetical protein HYV27_23955 [Candidatus Hydrogenedentes bacterium]|nr:hypothetical protein [Candidatus Hydrogenedentota bacterium]